MSEIKSYKIGWDKKSNLSNGGQATTILAASKEGIKNDVVIKILSAQNDDERRARMYRESVNLLTLSHSNLPKVIDTNAEHYRDKEYKLFIVMDFIPGPVLSNLNLTGTELEDKIDLIKQVLYIVEYCHKRGVIHRDIKPDNIILRDGNLHDPVLLDFGLSFNNEHLDNDDLTPDGQHLGNRFIILPEQKVGETNKRNDKTDITAVVGIFFYILTGITPTTILDEYGNKPHQRKEAKEIIDRFPKHQKDLLNNIFDIGFNQLIDKRWQSAQSLIEQLEYLRNSKPEVHMEEDEVIKKIKLRIGQPDYQDAKFLSDTYAEVDKNVRATLSEISRELGSDWGTIQSGGIGPSAIEYRNRLAPHNAVINLSLDTVIHAFSTGSELVIQIIEKDISKEALREPLASKHNWDQFRTILKKHYLTEIAKNID